MYWYEKLRLDRYLIIFENKKTKEGNIRIGWTTTDYIDEHDELSGIAIIDLKYIERPQDLATILKIYNPEDNFIEWILNFLSAKEPL